MAESNKKVYTVNSTGSDTNTKPTTEIFLESVKNHVSISCDSTKCVASWINRCDHPIFNLREDKTYYKNTNPKEYEMLYQTAVNRYRYSDEI
jgi:hypothetical protein